MRICILSRYPPDKGGIATHSYNLANELFNRGHDVTIITYKRLNRKSKKIRIYEIPVIDKFFLRGFSYFIGCLITLKKVRNHIDVINVHPVQSVGIVAILFKKIYNIPVIITSHGSDLLKWSEFPLIDKFFSSIVNSSDKLICVSNFLAKKAMEIGIKKDKIKVVHEGIKIPKSFRKISKKNLRKELGLPQKKKIVLFVGSLRREKRPDVLLEYARKVDCNFILIGDGPLKRQLKEFIEKYRLKNVKLLGPKENMVVLKFIRAVDLLIIPSEYEGFGLVAVEAMSLGTPIVARPVTALTEILTSESLSNDLKKRMIEILNNKQIKNNIIKKNKRRVEKFTPERMVDEIERIYEEISHNKT